MRGDAAGSNKTSKEIINRQRVENVEIRVQGVHDREASGMMCAQVQGERRGEGGEAEERNVHMQEEREEEGVIGCLLAKKLNSLITLLFSVINL